MYKTRSKSKKENKKTVVKIDDKEDELDSLVEEFASVQSKSKIKNKSQHTALRKSLRSKEAECRAAFDINDFEMDKLLTEFAENEKKDAVIKINDSENEIDSIIEEFTAAQSDSEDGRKESGAKVILSSSDNEIDELLDGFEEEE